MNERSLMHMSWLLFGAYLVLAIYRDTIFDAIVAIGLLFIAIEGTRRILVPEIETDDGNDYGYW